MLSAEEGLLPALVEVYMMEKGIWLFYRQVSEKSGDEKARKVFGELAEWENSHMRFIEYLYEGLRENRNIVTFEEFSRAEPQFAEGGAPLQELEGRIDEFSYIGDADAVAFAMGIESQEYEIYKSLSKRTTDPELKVVFEKLMDWELRHITYLKELRKDIRPQ